MIYGKEAETKLKKQRDQNNFFALYFIHYTTLCSL